MKKEQELEKIYANRFNDKEKMRKKLWQTLCSSYFQKYVKKTDTVIDLPAGYCEFINTINCKRKIAIDLNPNVKKMANKNVEVHLARSTSLPKNLENTADVVFISNFFEHLADQTELLNTLKEVKRVLKKDGQLLVLQPNIRLVGGAYWDYLDHTLPLTEKSLSEALEISGFDIKYMKTRFLPFSTDGKMPVIPILIRIYLAFPPLQFLLGKQTFVVARKS